MPNPTKNLVHLNNNQLVSFDVETTGLKAGYHEIIQLSCIPLNNNLEPSQEFPLFDIKIRPDFPHRIEYDAIRVSKYDMQEVMDTGIKSERAVELFEHWFKRLNLPLNKKIVPLGFNCCYFDIPFMRQWLGDENYNSYFFGQARDVYISALFINDYADFHAIPTPFPKLTLREVAMACGIELDTARLHDSLYDAFITAQTYKKMMFHPALTVQL